MKNENSIIPQIILEPASVDYDTDDQRWINQVEQLYRDLEEEVGEIIKVTTPVEGKKGGIEEVILKILTGGLVDAAVEIFKAWLGRDKSRTLTMKIIRDGKEEIFELSVNNISDEILIQTFKKLMGKM